MKTKKKFFILLIIASVLPFILTIASKAASIPEVAEYEPGPAYFISSTVVIVQIILFITAIILPAISIIQYIYAKISLIKKEKGELQDDSQIQLLKENVNRKKKKILISFIIGFIMYAITGVLQITKSFKPVIYIYPEEDNTEVTVTLSNPDRITCSYPEYNDGWRVIADKDGTIRQYGKDREYYSLYWEGLINAKEMKDGFVVKGEDTTEFLEEKLAILGLTDKEAEEFIIYWLPKLEGNKYNLIRFLSMEELNEEMELKVSPEPETLIRIQMQYKPLASYQEIPEQKLTPVERKGFTVVEWGGSRAY